jgi:hypothetical protein
MMSPRSSLRPELGKGRWVKTSLIVSRSEAAATSQGKSVSCGAGCGACCRQLVPLSEPLAIIVSQRIGVPAQLILLPLAPVWAAAHAELGQRSWPGPELFAHFVELVPGLAIA